MWRPDVEVERSVCSYGNSRGHWRAGQDVLCARIEFLGRAVSEVPSYHTPGRSAHLAKVHGLDTLTTQRRTDWRTWRCLTSPYDELDDLVRTGGSSLFRHFGGWFLTSPTHLTIRDEVDWSME